MSDEFPKWSLADTTLTNLVKRAFGIVINTDRTNPTDIIVDFIDLTECYDIPTEDKDHFFILYNKFRRKYTDKFNIENLTKDYKSKGKINRVQLEYEINKTIKKYEIDTKTSLSDILLREYFKVRSTNKWDDNKKRRR